MASFTEPLKLLLFTKMDGNVEEILYEVSYCQLYKFRDGEWSKTIIGGPLYLFKRNGQFYEHGLVLLKMRNSDDYLDYIYPFLKMWRQNDPYLMVRVGEKDIKGIWRYNLCWSSELDRMISFISENAKRFSRCEILKYDKFGTLIPIRLMEAFQSIIYDVVHNDGMPLSLPFLQRYQPTLQLLSNFHPIPAEPSDNSYYEEEDELELPVVHNDKPLFLLESFFTPQQPPALFSPSVKMFFTNFVLYYNLKHWD